MTKFGRSKKTETSGFGRFSGRSRTRAKLKDLKIQGILTHGIWLRSIKEPRWKKSKPKVEAAKIGYSSFEILEYSGFSEHTESD
jgi:hypothetical protein